MVRRAAAPIWWPAASCPGCLGVPRGARVSDFGGRAQVPGGARRCPGVSGGAQVPSSSIAL
eukprot:7826975-Pyramimonas_sp.AAC.1